MQCVHSTYMERNRSNSRISSAVSEYDETEYIEKVTHHMKILTLLNDVEVEMIQEGWKCITESEDFFRTAFSSIDFTPVNFREDEHTDDERFSRDFLKSHSVHVMNTVRTIVEDVKNPNSWMLELLRIATLHKLYGVTLEDLRKFQCSMLETLKQCLGECNFSPPMQEVWEKVVECVVIFINQAGIQCES
uniref:Globin domain-containing protein n=1 Tax=Graphocephala atropunctata TaxID=36148 RepID=A0A1B6KXW2_9HEMI